MTSAPQRLNILNLPERQQDLIVQAFAQLQNGDWRNKSSFFQLAGIHGWPRATYDDVTHRPLISGNLRVWSGYCTHGSVFFPTWHRVYLLAFEKALTDAAKSIADSYQGSDRDAYVEAANQLRLPYWDWLSADSPQQRLPPLLWESQIEINSPGGRQTVPNPMRQFTFSYEAQQDVDPVGINPTVAVGQATFREEERLLDRTLPGTAATLEDKRTAMLNYPYREDQWAYIASHSSNPFPNMPQWSHEDIHDDIHGILGGGGTQRPRGHMGDPQTAGFDPIFWLHHCNVDRLLDEWQMVHPTVWLPTAANEPNLNEETEMVPFYRTDGSGRFYNSRDVRWTWRGPEGYIYDVTNTDSAWALRQAIDEQFP